MKERRVAIIGGEGAMGKPTKVLFEKMGFETIVSDVKLPNSPKPLDAIKNATDVFFSVDPAVLTEIINEINQVDVNIWNGKVVLDNAGAKEDIKKTLLDIDSHGASVCSTHPLCGPSLNSWKGQKVTLVNVGKNFKTARQTAMELYRKEAGMRIISLSIVKHDKIMGPVQFRPHAAMRLDALVSHNLGTNFKKIAEVSTVNHDLYDLAFKSVNMQPGDTSARIIDEFRNTEYGKAWIAAVISGLNFLSTATRQELQVMFDNISKENFTEEDKVQGVELKNGIVKYLNDAKRGKK